MASGIVDLNSRAKINFSMSFLINIFKSTLGRRNPARPGWMASVFSLASFPFSDLEFGLLKYGGWAEKIRTSRGADFGKAALPRPF